MFAPGGTIKRVFLGAAVRIRVINGAEHATLPADVRFFMKRATISPSPELKSYTTMRSAGYCTQIFRKSRGQATHSSIRAFEHRGRVDGIMQCAEKLTVGEKSSNCLSSTAPHDIKREYCRSLLLEVLGRMSCYRLYIKAYVHVSSPLMRHHKRSMEVQRASSPASVRSEAFHARQLPKSRMTE